VTTATLSPTLVAGDEALAVFRQGLTGAHALHLLHQAHGRLLVQLPVGVGKTAWLIAIISHALATALHDLVITLVPRWDVLNELLKRLPANLSPAVLRPRPRKRCGDLDPPWLEYEQNSCGALGRAQLCATCPRYQGCRWPGQYGSRLRGKRLILATQQHLTLNPSFLVHLQQQTRATNPLVLLDESNLLIRPTDRLIRSNELAQFIQAQASLPDGIVQSAQAASAWLETSRLLAQAPTRDLQEGDWRLPWVDLEWATAVQQHGRHLFEQAFRFLGYELHHFAHSDPCSRERLPSGDIRFAALPYLGKQFIIFSGSVAKELARYRLDPSHARPTLVSPFEQHRFEHPGTRWFNLHTLDGAAKFFPKNAGRILDFIAAKVARNIEQGKCTLLVSRKKFIRLCRRLLRERLAELGVGPVTVATGNWARHDLHDPRTVALINYGVAGLNRFEHCEAAYCLNSYFVTPAVVSAAVQDVESSGERYPVRIETIGDPPQRRVQVELPDGREPLLPRVAQAVLEQKEADMVVQAVGRVRPFTRPREVITFHVGDLPGVRYTMSFRTLEQARSYFRIQTPAQADLASRVEQAWRLKATGHSKRQIAQKLGVSLSTVKRYLRQQGGS
jgi:hypothetical protein